MFGSHPRSGNVTKTGHVFSRVPVAEIQRSSFDRSHGHKTTFDAGFLIPVLVDEILPGDTYSLDMTALARLATPIFPLMDNLYLDSFFFAVPYRLIWTNFPKFFGEQANPGDSTSFLVPVFLANGATQYGPSGLADYMGIPPGLGAQPGIQHSSLPMRAYNLVYNTWFRDQNMINSAVVDLGDGPDNPASYVLRRRGKRHDYFTSALPFPQKGVAVTIPQGGGLLPVTNDGTTLIFAENAAGTTNPGNIIRTAAGANTAIGTAAAGGALGTQLFFKSGLQVNLSAAAAATVNQLRQSFAIQKLLERDARGGTRLTEIIEAHFRVKSPDARMQRPEYLGGGSTPITLNAIPQTAPTAAGVTPMGTLAAMGTVVATRHGFTKSFTEHCILLGIVSVRADLTYQQGLERMWSRQTRNDHYWPALSHIGEQAINQGEIFATGVPAQDNVVFGYAERYAEYRYKPSRISSELRSTFATPLDAWHLSQKFTSAPVLNQAFIEETPPVSRVIAVSASRHFIFDSFFRMHCARPMPVYGVPGFIDRF